MTDFADLSIDCPHCGKPVELTAAIRDALAAPLVDAERKKVDEEVARRLAAEGDAIAKKAVEATEIAMGAKLHAMEACRRGEGLEVGGGAEGRARRCGRNANDSSRKEGNSSSRFSDASTRRRRRPPSRPRSRCRRRSAKLGDAQIGPESQAAKLAEAQQAELALRQERERLDAGKERDQPDDPASCRRREEGGRGDCGSTAGPAVRDAAERGTIALSAKDAQLREARAGRARRASRRSRRPRRRSSEPNSRLSAALTRSGRRCGSKPSTSVTTSTV